MEIDDKTFFLAMIMVMRCEK
jgi:putative Ca2+/H+ antiporter (TMEM165/GDT1 family)